MPVLETNCIRKCFLRKPATLRRQMQKSSSSNTLSKTPGRQQNRMAATDRVRYKTSQYHDHVPGVFDHLLEELVLCVCLLRGAASHKKRLPTRFAFSSVTLITIMIFMQPQWHHKRPVRVKLVPCNGFGCCLFQTLGVRLFRNGNLVFSKWSWVWGSGSPSLQGMFVFSLFLLGD